MAKDNFKSVVNSYKKPELLSPAGSPESIIAAVQNGCDAVYVGANSFSARQNAKNFTPEELEKALDYCHVRGVRLYVAANTLIKNNELKSFVKFVESIYLIGADGVIVQDVGCAEIIKRSFPDFYLLASTQMTVHDKSGVNYLYEKGFGRVILSRELSLDEIAGICESSKAEIECFIHGALCVCYSGQCLMSSFNGGRSGNRGLCAQPCRLEHTLAHNNRVISKGSLLSPKDMLGLYELPKLIDAGVKSFKIEGRMKSPEYVAGVTHIYRKYIDKYFDNPTDYFVDKDDIRLLAQIFNRSGFSNGYLHDYSGKDMLTDGKVGNSGVYIGKLENQSGTCFKTLFDVAPGDGIEIYSNTFDNHPGAYITQKRKSGELVEINLKNKANVKLGDLVYRTYDKTLIDSLNASYQKDRRKSPVSGFFSARLGERISIEVWLNDIKVNVDGNLAESAKTIATDSEKIKAQLCKTGNTPFNFKELKVSVGDNVYINVKELNELRRRALSELESRLIKKYKRNAELSVAQTVYNNEERLPKLTVLVRTNEQLRAVYGYKASRIYVDFDAANADIEKHKKNGAEIFRCLPRIQRDLNCFKNDFYDCRYDGYLVRTFGQAGDIKGHNYALDYTLNAFNNESMKFFEDKGCKSICISPEITERGLFSNEKSELLIYGKVILMTTVQCPIGNFAADKTNKPFCKYKNKSGGYTIINERTGREYELLTDCGNCHCMILDSKPINALTKIRDLNSEYIRIDFTNESTVDINNIMSTITDNEV